MTISIGVGIVCLQEPFLEKRNISHSTFNFYYLGGSKTDA